MEWSPTHKSELFWLDNASKLEENDLEILRYSILLEIILFYNIRCLARILSESEESIKLAIACHDVGQYIDHVPLGKKYFTHFINSL